MPDVLAELARFTEYASIFGKTAPPLEYVVQTATAASQWSATCVKLARRLKSAAATLAAAGQTVTLPAGWVVRTDSPRPDAALGS